MSRCSGLIGKGFAVSDGDKMVASYEDIVVSVRTINYYLTTLIAGKPASTLFAFSLT